MTDTLLEEKAHSPDDFFIRPVRIEDAEPLADYMKAILKDRMSSMADLDEMIVNVHRQRENIRRVQTTQAALAIVAWKGPEIIGYLNVEPGRRRKIRHVAEIGMSVREGHRRRGVGLALMEYAEAWARKTGKIEKLALNVFSGNEAAIRLYEKAGYEVEGVLKRQINLDGEYQDLILMGKLLQEG
jgi:RimJ/RimL family protein N-acetyltransferase